MRKTKNKVVERLVEFDLAGMQIRVWCDEGAFPGYYAVMDRIKKLHEAKRWITSEFADEIAAGHYYVNAVQVRWKHGKFYQSKIVYNGWP